MKLGFLTPYSQERVEFARDNGFNCLELQANAGSNLDPRNLSDDDIKKMRDTLSQNNVSASALACYMNHLEEGKEAENAEYFARVLALAPKLGCNVVATVGGATQETRDSGDITKSIPQFKEVFTKHAKTAEENGVKIAFENWPGGHPAPLLINVAVSPAAWDAMFDAVPSPALGLEYDPSHLARLMIDYIAPIRKYADRIHHVHAKDTTIKDEVLNSVGYIGQGWWTYSIPGRGAVDWSAFFRELKAIGYDGGVVIEHEDMDYWNDKFDDGLKLGQQFLSQRMA